MPLLAARGLNVVYEPARGQRIWAVRETDLVLEQGEFAGLVGESGCGKTTLGYALTRMLRPPARLESGVISFGGTDIAALGGEQLRLQRRNGFALVMQSGMNTLNPVRTIARHFGDVMKAHARPGDDVGTPGLRRRAGRLTRRRSPRRRPARPVPARTVRRDAATGLDRARAGARPAVRRLRRADHRARCDRGAGRPADDQGPAARTRFHRAADQPRPGHGARGDRPGRGHVRGADRRRPARRRPGLRAAPPVHRGAARLLRRSPRRRGDGRRDPELARRICRCRQAGCSFAPRCARWPRRSAAPRIPR